MADQNIYKEEFVVRYGINEFVYDNLESATAMLWARTGQGFQPELVRRESYIRITEEEVEPSWYPEE